MDTSGNFRLQKDTSNYLRVGSSAFELKTDNLDIDTTTLDITALGTNKTSRISLGASPPTDFTSNGIIVSGSGFFNFQSGASQFLRSSGDGIELQSARLSILTTGTNKIKIDSTATPPVMSMG